MWLLSLFQRKISPIALIGIAFIFVGSIFLILSLWHGDFLLPAGTLMGSGLLLFLLARNHPSADLVHRYYQALAQQDYELAFQYLSPKMGMTWSRFQQQVQTTDTAQGRVTAHLITRFSFASYKRSLRINHASFTVKVKRGEQWDRAYPYLVKEDKQWKIRYFARSHVILNNEH